jgi:hypothetical protein
MNPDAAGTQELSTAAGADSDRPRRRLSSSSGNAIGPSPQWSSTTVRAACKSSTPELMPHCDRLSSGLNPDSVRTQPRLSGQLIEPVVVGRI